MSAAFAVPLQHLSLSFALSYFFICLAQDWRGKSAAHCLALLLTNAISLLHSLLHSLSLSNNLSSHLFCLGLSLVAHFSSLSTLSSTLSLPPTHSPSATSSHTPHFDRIMSMRPAQVGNKVNALFNCCCCPHTHTHTGVRVYVF